MNAVFVDTGYWIALFDKGDGLHQKALDLLRVYGFRRLMTSEMVLTEFLNHFASRVYLREKAILFVESLQAQTNLTIEPQTPELFAEALRLYKARPDKEWSLTDCASFSVCYAAGVAEALAYDNHFAQAGIRPLLRD